MRRPAAPGILALAVALLAAPAASAAPTIANGGFENGLTSWVRVDQAGGDGTFALQTGASSPLNADPVPPPPEGTTAAMTDAFGPGSHVLYQDFAASAVMAMLSFDLFLGNRADRYATPGSLDFALTNIDGSQTLNQQARVDILRAGADPFSIAAGDVLLSLFATNVGDALVMGYTTITTDLTALLAAHDGELLRLRFAETDNLAQFQMGIDNVSIQAAQAVPEPATLLLVAAVGAGLATRVARRRTGGTDRRLPH